MTPQQLDELSHELRSGNGSPLELSQPALCESDDGGPRDQDPLAHVGHDRQHAVVDEAAHCHRRRA
ncbi:MAG TPA: hypothetical protein VFI46_14600 [Jiangellaceae bacterium]|nr:hypothetical protein [Jiangellaceae bacterium]